MGTIEIVLYPLIALLGWILDLLHTVTGSWGLSIILLSMITRLAATPIARRAQRAEQREQALQLSMAPALADIKTKYRGRARFEAVEELYEKHGYHPIHSMASLLPLLLQIPILLSALFLLTSHEELTGESFLILRNLGAPDALFSLGVFGSINLLPIFLTLIAMTEASIKQGATTGSRAKFILVSAVIAVLIYPLPSAVCLYWLTSNSWSLASELWSTHSSKLPNGSDQKLNS